MTGVSVGESLYGENLAGVLSGVFVFGEIEAHGEVPVLGDDLDLRLVCKLSLDEVPGLVRMLGIRCDGHDVSTNKRRGGRAVRRRERNRTAIDGTGRDSACRSGRIPICPASKACIQVAPFSLFAALGMMSRRSSSSAGRASP